MWSIWCRYVSRLGGRNEETEATDVTSEAGRGKREGRKVEHMVEKKRDRKEQEEGEGNVAGR